MQLKEREYLFGKKEKEYIVNLCLFYMHMISMLKVIFLFGAETFSFGIFF